MALRRGESFLSRLSLFAQEFEDLRLFLICCEPNFIFLAASSKMETSEAGESAK